MKETNKNIIPALIIAIGLIISILIYAYSTRYEIVRNGYVRVDKWTGTMIYIDPEK